MAYLTEYSYNQLIERIEILNLDRIDMQFFKSNIFNNEYLFYFFNQFELKKLLKEKLLLSGEKDYPLFYKEVPQRLDNQNYVLEIKGKVKYHKDSTCLALNRGFKNFFMPEPIVRLKDGTEENEIKHEKIVIEIRKWFVQNNFDVDRYLNGEISDNFLTTKFNEHFPKTFDIDEISFSQTQKGDFKWYIERKTKGNVGIEKTFDYNNFLTKIIELIKDRDYICNGSTLQNLSKYDFLAKREDYEIAKHIKESISNGYLKNVDPIFITNYGMQKLKDFWNKHLSIKTAAINILSEYFKWTYKYNEKSFDEIFLEDFNLEPCGLCH